MSGIVVDMHTHTSCSDGMLAPDALVEKAAARGLQILAITDHDTIEGIGPAQQAGLEFGVSIIPGVELSIRFRGRELHLLGYYFDRKHEGLREFLKQYQVFRTQRARAILVRLSELGMAVEFEEVRALAAGPAIGRPHIAQVLVDKGYVPTVEDAFSRYLRNRGPADVSKELPTAESAITILHEAGGIAVLAHPGHWVTDKDIDLLHELGLDGIEIVHPSHDDMLVDFYKDVAHNFSMLATGGSDFHGKRSHDEENSGEIGFTREQFQRFEQKRAA